MVIWLAICLCGVVLNHAHAKPLSRAELKKVLGQSPLFSHLRGNVIPQNVHLVVPADGSIQITNVDQDIAAKRVPSPNQRQKNTPQKAEGMVKTERKGQIKAGRPLRAGRPIGQKRVVLGKKASASGGIQIRRANSKPAASIVPRRRQQPSTPQHSHPRPSTPKRSSQQRVPSSRRSQSRQSVSSRSQPRSPVPHRSQPRPSAQESPQPRPSAPRGSPARQAVHVVPERRLQRPVTSTGSRGASAAAVRTQSAVVSNNRSKVSPKRQTSARKPIINDRMANSAKTVQTSGKTGSKSSKGKKKETCDFNIPTSLLPTDPNITQTDFEQQYLLPALAAQLRSSKLCRSRELTVYINFLLQYRQQMFKI